MSTLTRSRSCLLIVGAALLITGCAPTYQRPAIAPEDASLYAELPENAATGGRYPDLQRALLEHDTYFTHFQSIVLTDRNACGGVSIEAHRGDARESENSTAAIVRALDAGAHSVEIDIMRLADGTWVLHHDPVTGRAVGRADGKQMRISRMNKRQWLTLRHRDGATGALTEFAPPTLPEAISHFMTYASPDQRLNIELKSEIDNNQADRLVRFLASNLEPGQFGFSSSSLESLVRIRAVDPSVYIGFVQQPVPNSIAELRSTMERGIEGDRFAERHSRWIDLGADLGQRHYGRKFKNWMTPRGLAEISANLGPNVGVHLDVRQYHHRPQIKQMAASAGIHRLATYSVNGPDYHLGRLVELRDKGQLPDTAIMDVTAYRACRHFVPHPKQASTVEIYDDLPAAVAALPGSADLEQIDEQLPYVNGGQYIRLDGSVQPLHKSAAPLPARSQAPPKRSRPKRSDEPADWGTWKRPTPIQVEVKD